MDAESFQMLKDIISDRKQKLEAQIETFETELIEKIEEAKNNEILKAVNALGTRLTAIENQLREAEPI